MSNNSKVILALDFEREKDALNAIEPLSPANCKMKIGKGMFTRYGPSFVEKIMAKGFDVFLDLKFHDIPNTVAMACKAAAEMGVWMLNVHCLGGLRMLQAAQQSIAHSDTLLIGVTLLTSMDQEDLKQIGINGEPKSQVVRLANLASQAGLHGVVCSAQEAGMLREQFGSSFLLVTPGIRLTATTDDDQRRIVTPVQALRNGADYLVIGRPVLAAADPAAELDRINHEISRL